jgi:hypothetical protein
LLSEFVVGQSRRVTLVYTVSVESRGIRDIILWRWRDSAHLRQKSGHHDHDRKEGLDGDHG